MGIRLHSSTANPLEGAAKDQLVHIFGTAAQHATNGEYYIRKEETVFSAKNVAKLSI